MPLPDSCDVRFDKWSWKARLDCEVHFNLSFKELLYPMPDLSVGIQRVRTGTALGELCALAALLSKAFTWSAAESTMFVLTDCPPLLATATRSLRRGNRYPCLSRIDLSIDPAMSPRQVEALYRDIRSQALAGRYRNLTQKHAILAAFTARNAGALSDQMQQWNREYSRWKYKSVTNFGRDSKAARDRLLKPTNLRLEAVLGGIDGKTKTR